MAARFQILQGCVQSRIEITQKGRFLIFDSNWTHAPIIQYSLSYAVAAYNCWFHPLCLRKTLFHTGISGVGSISHWLTTRPSRGEGVENLTWPSLDEGEKK